MWTGRKDANGGSCLVAWEKVMRPIDLGGLGIHNLEIMGWALQMRWLWLEKTSSDQPWAGLQVPIYANTSAMFAISIETTVGNGRNTLFWTDRWMHGCCLADLAPEVVQCVPVRLRNRRTVYEALNNNAWVADIRNALGLHGLTEYLELWDLISEVNLTDTDDLHRWKPEASGVFSTKSAYRCYFVGSITFEPWKRIWKTWAPGKCKTFLWLAIRNRCG